MDLLVVTGAALALYAATLAPTIIWGDSTWLTLYALKDIITVGGPADHPLYLTVGKLFLLLPGDPARNMALESATFAALAVALVYRISRQLGTSRLGGFTGAAALCVSHAFWLHAVIPEVYTTNAFFLLAAITLLLEWDASGRVLPAVGAAVAWMLGLTNHLVLAGLVPAALAFIALARPHVFLTRRSLATAALVVAGMAAMVAGIPGIAAAVHRIWVGPPGVAEYFSLTMPLGGMLRESGYYLLYLAFQFPSVTLPLAIVGIVILCRERPRQAVLLLGAIAVNAGVFIHHTAWSSTATAKFVFYISDYAIISVFCAVGADEAVTLLRRSAAQHARAAAVGILVLAALMPPAVYAVLPTALRIYGIDLVQAKTVPYRDNNSYFLTPSKRGYFGARRYAEETLRSLPPSAVLYADYTPATVIRYVQLAERVRPDVLLRVGDGVGGDRVRVTWAQEHGEPRRIFVATMTADYYDFSGLTGDYEFVPVGPVFEVRPRD